MSKTDYGVLGGLYGFQKAVSEEINISVLEHLSEISKFSELRMCKSFAKFCSKKYCKKVKQVLKRIFRASIKDEVRQFVNEFYCMNLNELKEVKNERNSEKSVR